MAVGKNHFTSDSPEFHLISSIKNEISFLVETCLGMVKESFCINVLGAQNKTEESAHLILIPFGGWIELIVIYICQKIELEIKV